MTYSESIRYLYALGNEVHTAKLGLDRIRRLLRELGDPQNACRFVHVAGTNGKGSTCAMIEAGLRAAGVRTGLYTSPHLIEPTERIVIDGRQIGEDQFAAAFERVHRAAEGMLEAGELDMHPTYFETVTAMGFLLFQEHKVDTAVIEVGLGGRLDATNVVCPELCVITPISYDHQSFLGDTLEQIASEKYGILKPGIPAVVVPAPDVPRPVISAPVTYTSDWSIEDLELTARGSTFHTRGLEIHCPLAGEHQAVNALAATIALRELGYSPAGIAQTEWPGRLERMREQPEIILDGAHNIAGTQALVHYIERFYFGRRILLVYGVMRDKAVREMTEMLFPLAERVIATAPANSRSLPPKQVPGDNVEVAPTVREAIELIRREAFPTDVVFITGSLFLVGEARAILNALPS
jgi:dihydrofolate synthase/folylpolyglutamate synthase